MSESAPKVNWVILALGMVVVVPLVFVLATGFGNDPRAVPNALVGKQAPAFAMEDLDGNEVTLSSLEGRPVVLNFWSTWCLPCKQEHGLLQTMARDTPGVAFFGVLYSDEPDKARRYLKRAGAAYPTLVDVNNRAAIDYGVAGVPETYFIGRDGTVVHKHVGPLNPRTLQALLEQLEAT